MTSATDVTEVPAEQLRLMSVVARLYHVQGLRQCDIADRLRVSQASVSRLLSQAQVEGIVQTVVDVPAGLHPELEERIEDEFGVSEVHVVEVLDGDAEMASTLGRAAARLFPAQALSGRVIGFASGSPTLQAMALALHDPMPRSRTRFVVETFAKTGGAEQWSAAEATRRLADALGATSVLLRLPVGVWPAHLRQVVTSDPAIARALRLLDRIDVAFVDVGPSCHRPGPAGARGQIDGSPRVGADPEPVHVAGHVNQRFVDEYGRPVPTPTDDLVVGLTLAQLQHARRRVAVAGGDDKRVAILAALRGKWVDSLMTDLGTARHLVEQGAATPCR